MSNLSQIVMDMEEEKAKYDQTMKELLSDRQVLAWILKRFVPEYQDCELEDIEKKYIQAETIMVSKIGMEQDSETIQGIRNEDAVQGEATVLDVYKRQDTIMVHVRNIREKIEINPKNPKYLKVVWGVGYKMEKQ